LFQNGWAGGLIIEAARIEGKIFKMVNEAEPHALQQAKGVIDKQRLELSWQLGCSFSHQSFWSDRAKNHLPRCRCRMRSGSHINAFCGAKQDDSEQIG